MAKNTLQSIETVLNKIDNDELLLLKGHLLIEEFLKRRLEMEYGSEVLKALDLSFYKKTILFAGITKLPIESDIIDWILRINKLRNKLAHTLELDVRIGFVDIIRHIYGGLPKTINRKVTYFNAAKKVFYITLGYISGLIEVNEALKELHVKSEEKNH